MESNQYCTFHLGDLYFGVEVDRVQEVLREQPMTRVPRAPREIEGLINLRGQIVTAVNLHERLSLPGRAGEKPLMNVVLRSESGAGVSLLVDEIDDVVEADAGDFEAAPETLADEIRALIHGVFKLDGQLLHVLDVDETVRGGTAAAAERGASS